MAEVSLQLDKRREKKDKTHPIKLIVYFERKNQRFGLEKKYSLSEEQWEKMYTRNLKNADLLEIKKYDGVQELLI